MATKKLFWFSKAGESVCGILIKEIVENVDRPNQLSSKILIENDQELEWIMQFINHAFGLPFYNDSTYATLSAAVRIYLAWMTALTTEPHKCCPEPLRAYPDRYFRRMIDAFRSIFIPKALSSPADVEAELCRQGNEIRTILTAVRHLTSAVQDDYKDEVWSRSLLFLMAVCDQLLSETRTKDEIGCLISADLSQALFDCWTKAALLEYIPSPSYWRTFSALTWKWLSHVPVVEWWARKLLSLTILIVQDLYGQKYCNIPLSDSHFMEAIRLQDDKKIVQDVWLNMFQLIGNPVQCYMHMHSLGDSSVSIDFHECDELQAQWCDAVAALQEDRAQSSTVQRSSNLSSSAIAVLETMQALSATAENNGENSRISQHLAGNRKSFINIASDSIQQQQNGGSNITPPKGDSLISTHAAAGQMVWYILRSNRMKSIRGALLDGGPSTGAMMELFMGWLFDAALIPLTLSHGSNKCTEDLHSQKSLSVDGGSSFNGITGAPYSQPSSQSHSNSATYLSQHSQQQPLPSPTISASSSSAAAAVAPSQSQMYSRSGTQDESSSFIVSNSLINDPITRRSFAAQSTASSSEVAPATPGHSSNSASVFDYPSVDGVVAGRAAALGSLCKIVCAKSTDERLTDEQLAHFFLVLHEALIERDRIILCSLLYYSVDLFKLNFRGVEILLPNYLAAIDIILTESVRLRLHPSIHPYEMRNACLRALSSIIAWPNVFGHGKIFSCETANVSSSQHHGRLLKSNSMNNLEDTLSYLDLRHRMLRILLHVLRNEVDANNLHLALGLCQVFCASNAKYDISKRDPPLSRSKNAQPQSDDSEDENSKKCFAVSALRGVVSAICDNLCKHQWNNDLVICLAALDCLNSLATLPHTVLFYKNELSTGSLIVTSLCRFVDTQLQKPPMLHSRDLHSSIVLAYFTLANWISSAPMLTEIESCFSTLAHIIEFGMTGGKGMSPSEYKPASQRVCDAADFLLNILFNLPSSTKPKTMKSNDEMQLMRQFGTDNISLSKFKYFLINETALIGFHEAQHIHRISRGFPTVFAVIRTPYQRVHTTYYQLRPKSSLASDFSSDKENAADSARSPGALSVASSNATGGSQTEKAKQSAKAKHGNADASLSSVEPIKQFAFPPGIHDVNCKLDAESRSLELTPEIAAIQNKLAQMRAKLDQGSTGSDYRDERNVWTQPSMDSLLAQLVQPEDAVEKCNSLRVFLYDMGLISRRAFGRDLIAVDSTTNNSQFLEKLSVNVDKMPINLLEIVSVFYVKKGQQKAEEILQNCERLEKTSAKFCGFLNRLGKGADISSGFPHWTGSWKSAFSTKANQHVPAEISSGDHYVLNGLRHILYHSTSQVEIAFITPTLSSCGQPVSSCGGMIHSPKSTEITSANTISASFSLEGLDDLLIAAQKPTGRSIFVEENEKGPEIVDDKNKSEQQQQQSNTQTETANVSSAASTAGEKDVEGKNVGKVVKSMKERQPSRKNSGFLASLTSFWSFTTGLSNNTAVIDEKDEKESENSRDDVNKAIPPVKMPATKDENTLHSDPKEARKTSQDQTQSKDTMMIFQRTGQPEKVETSTPQLSRGYLRTSVEKIANLEREYRQNLSTGTNFTSFKPMEKLSNENGTGDYTLNTISEEVEHHVRDEMDERSDCDGDGENNSEQQQTKSDESDPKPAEAPKISLSNALTHPFEAVSEEGNDLSSPVYKTTIITAGTSERPCLSMAQATSVMIKSARFSAKRRDAAVLNAARTFKSRTETRRSSLATFPSMEKWDKENSNASLTKLLGGEPVLREGIEGRRDSLLRSGSEPTEAIENRQDSLLRTESTQKEAVEQKDSVLRSESVLREAEGRKDSSVIAFSPLSAMAVEFPITTSQQPLTLTRNEANEQSASEEEAIDDIFRNSSVEATDTIRPKKLPNTRRRMTLAKIGLEAIGRNRSSSNLLERISKQSTETASNSPNTGVSLPSALNNPISNSPTTIKKPFRSLGRRRNSSAAFFASPPATVSGTKFTFNHQEESDRMTSKSNEPSSPNNKLCVPAELANNEPSSPEFGNLSTSAATISFIKSFFRRKSQHLHPDLTEIVDENDIDLDRTAWDEAKPISDEILEMNYGRKPSSVLNGTVDSVNEHNANIGTAPNLRISDVSNADNPGSNLPWQSSGLPPIGGQKSNAWQNISALMAVNSERNSNPKGQSAEKLAKRSLDMKIFVVWLERMEDMYNFPFDELLMCLDESNTAGAVAGGSVSSARRSSSLNASSPVQTRAPTCSSKFADFMIIYLCEVGDHHPNGLIHVQTEGVWTRKYGQPAPLIDGMVVPAAVLAPLIQQTVCSVARRKMIEVENYQFNHIKRRQSIMEFSRSFASNISYAEFFERYVNNENNNQSKSIVK